MLWLRIPNGTPLAVNASALCMIRPRSWAACSDMAAVREEHGVLHHQYGLATTGDTRRRRFPMRLQYTRRTRLGIVEQPIRRLRTRPRPARLVDGRGRRLGQLFGSLQQTTVQTFVAQISAGKLLRHPLDRLY